MARCSKAESVRSVSFSGSPRYDDMLLAATIVTHGASFANRWFGVGSARCADSLEIQRDAIRIAVLHRAAGWFQARVTASVDDTPGGKLVHFEITPGREAILDTVVITGLPEAPQFSGSGRSGRSGVRRTSGRGTAGGGAFDAPFRALEGKRFDRAQVDTTLESVLLRLRNVGYARAGRPRNSITIDSANATVRLELDFEVGPRFDIGNITVTVQGIGDAEPKTDSADVMRLIGLRSGQRFRVNQILEAQRALYRTEAFRAVLIDTVTPDSAHRVVAPDSIVRNRDSSAVDSVVNTGVDSVADRLALAAAAIQPATELLDIRIAVAETKMRSARAGVGWATQDCVRFQSRLSDRGFLGVGRRVEFALRASKIGVGDPVDFAPGLCSRAARADPFSEHANYYAGVSLTNSRTFGLPLSPVLNIYSERRSEPFAYLRETTIGALAEVSTAVGQRSAVSGGFQYENGRTVSDPLQVCSRFGQCTPEDISQSLFGRGVSIVSFSGTHDRTDDGVDPSRGSRYRMEVRAGETSSLLAHSLKFYRASGEMSIFRRAPGGIIGARILIAREFARGVQSADGILIPPEERLFGGGQSTVRGYQQNLLGPLIYKVVGGLDTSYVDGMTIVETSPGSGFERAVPRGGTALTVFNLEYRKPFTWLAFPMQLVAFLDAGNVWEIQQDVLKVGDLRATPGIGLRVVTPVGPFRVDIGYRPYEASAGRAFYFEPGADGETGRILCVSPGNMVNADPASPGNVSQCPATYRPPVSRGVLSRLAFHFGLGQAF